MQESIECFGCDGKGYISVDVAIAYQKWTYENKRCPLCKQTGKIYIHRIETALNKAGYEVSKIKEKPKPEDNPYLDLHETYYEVV